MGSGNNTNLVAYVPSPHAGYLKFFRAYEGSTLYVLGDEFTQQFQSLVRNLPAVRPEEARKMIQTLGIFANVDVLTSKDLEIVRRQHIVMPDEDVSHALTEEYFPNSSVRFDGRWRLRWDWKTTHQNRRPEGEHVVSTKELDRELMRSAFEVANRSPDWWRQIGALLADEEGGALLAACNQHVPHEQSAYLMGDPRSNFEPGQCIELSNAAHAEMVILATAAARGIKTHGCSLYVSTFPCPPCAYPWAFSGIKRLYYADGYSLVAGAETLEAKDVEIIRVEM